MDITERRLKIITGIVLAFALIVVFRLIQMQVVKGAEYRELSENRRLSRLTLTAPRGEIFDRNGEPLVTNRMGFSLIFQRDAMTSGDINTNISKVVDVFESTGDTYIDDLPISATSPFTFTKNVTNINSLITNAKLDAKLGWQKIESEEQIKNLSAVQAIDYLCERYDIDQTLDSNKKRKIIGVRYEMEKRVFSTNNPYTFATDISNNAVAIIKERNDCPGVVISVEPIREYTDPDLASHILGTVGVIYSEEYQQLKDKGYSSTDIIGKYGLEKALEPYLRGEDGVQAVTQKSGGGNVTEVSQEPTPGDYAVLTIDADLQATLEESMARVIPSLTRLKDSYDADSGAAVVLDVNSGEVLAMASYPTFNLETYSKDYQKIATSPTSPELNRAISGTYEPGSTFKVLTAIAALEEKVTTTSETIVDEGIYRFYKDYQPTCWVWTDQHKTHGPVNIVDAIKVSCNYFFYEMGRRLGIDRIVKYADMFGLGDYTGLEISGESKGTVAGREYAKQNGITWYDGLTLQAAIGQSYNLFTPVQLANYIATVANGGTLYSAHLVKSIKSYDGSENINYQPVIKNKVDMSAATHEAVVQGMKDVTEGGTAASVFSNYQVEVAAKTGTASVPTGSANGIFVAFAPADDPEIAISVVVHHGGHGNSIAPIAKDVFDEYFSVDQVEDEILQPNKLLP
ncbi:MAG: hypothetical protein LBM38_00050 [Clostridiales bacterium]|jgi:penicillin-binding protein 2|nr:hypothetical protein [Clostridiales bacterium]